MQRKNSEVKKGHQYLDAMRPTTCVRVPLERNRMENSQFKEGGEYQVATFSSGHKDKKQLRRGERDVNMWTSV